jgi:phosphatidylserine/phosphatidylglycerophosphate/cardiolipin synthase-like enzyme
MTLITCALGPDSAGTLLTALLTSAQRSLEACMYEVGPAYRWAFVEAARRGVSVRLLLDRHGSDGNVATAGELIRAGGECRVPPAGSGEAHAKVIAVDGSQVAVGTGNLIWRDSPRDAHGVLPPRARPLSGTREWWALAGPNHQLGRDVVASFDAAWRESVPPPPRWAGVPDTAAPAVGTPRPQVAPLTVPVSKHRLRFVAGGAAVRWLLAGALRAAERRILVTLPYVVSCDAARPLLTAMEEASRRGVDARLLLGEPPDLERASPAVATRFMDATRSTRGHAKGVVVDGRAFVTSANWSSTGLGPNWEAALVVDQPDCAAYFAEAWERDWSLAREPGWFRG